MNRDEAYKLLGVYATGSLTDEERRILFEAALEDQRLFNALQDEQALKDLLDDPFSREQIRKAAIDTRTKPAWMRYGWMWASAASIAVASLVVVLALRRESAPSPAAAVTMRQPAAQDELKPAAPPTSVKQEQASRPAIKDIPAALRPRLSSRAGGREKYKTQTPQEPASAPVHVAAAEPEKPTIAAQFPPFIPPPSGNAATAPAAPAVTALRESETSGYAPRAAKAMSYSGLAAAPPRVVSYILAKRLDTGLYAAVAPTGTFHAGDVLRITVVSAIPGRLWIESRDTTSMEWKRLYPLGDDSINVAAGEQYTVPVPLEVKSGQQVRTVIVPERGSALTIEAPLQVAP